MPIVTSGLRAAVSRFANADARLKAALEPVVREGLHKIGAQAQANASFSSQIPGQEFEHAGFLSGEVGFTEVGYPHRGKVHVFEGNGEAPAPFIAMVYGGPGESVGMTHPFLGPAARDERPEVLAEARAAVHKALS